MMAKELKRRISKCRQRISNSLRADKRTIRFGCENIHRNNTQLLARLQDDLRYSELSAMGEGNLNDKQWKEWDALRAKSYSQDQYAKKLDDARFYLADLKVS